YCDRGIGFSFLFVCLFVCGAVLDFGFVKNQRNFILLFCIASFVRAIGFSLIIVVVLIKCDFVSAFLCEAMF
ncbi:hypothetical protein, partial [Achromobacter xylosoxidans]|uniref:hypothetical protein n=1 Tax=Alcaligenes xylosoxydans xylosoxydans TaxID=85698 RepID=UPI001E570CD0